MRCLLDISTHTAGLDAFSRRRVWGLIRHMREMGRTVFVTTHYIEDFHE